MPRHCCIEQDAKNEENLRKKFIEPTVLRLTRELE